MVYVYPRHKLKKMIENTIYIGNQLIVREIKVSEAEIPVSHQLRSTLSQSELNRLQMLLLGNKEISLEEWNAQLDEIELMFSSHAQ